MFCSQCGKKNEDGYKFCCFCGANLKQNIVVTEQDLVREYEEKLQQKKLENEKYLYVQEEIVKQLTAAQIGDVVNFGNFQGEDLLWEVLDSRENIKLLFCAKGVVFMKSIDPIWEKSSARQWLNNDFVNGSFNNFQKNLIVVSDVLSQGQNALKLRKTEDKVFMLSEGEIVEYFGNDEQKRRCGVLNYMQEWKTRKVAKVFSQEEKMIKYCEGLDGRGNCKWWLRSHPGCCHDIVDTNGNFDNYAITYNHVAVRPAMWVRC